MAPGLTIGPGCAIGWAAGRMFFRIRFKPVEAGAPRLGMRLTGGAAGRTTGRGRDCTRLASRRTAWRFTILFWARLRLVARRTTLVLTRAGTLGRAALARATGRAFEMVLEPLDALLAFRILPGMGPPISNKIYIAAAINLLKLAKHAALRFPMFTPKRRERLA